MKTFLRWLVRVLYGFRSFNEGGLKAPGPVLLLPNHVSWWDWLFIGVCLDDDWRFVTSSTTARVSWVHRWIMVNRRTFPVDINSPYAVKHMAEYLQKGGRLVLFPEGRISTTGSLMKLFDGTGFLLLKTHAKVVTAYIRGGERLPFSRSPNRKRWFPRISVHFSGVLTPPVYPRVSTTEAREKLTDWLRGRMLQQRFETEMAMGPGTIPEAILETARGLGRLKIVQDLSLKTVSYGWLLTGARVLAAQWKRLLSGSGARVGVLLPNVNAMPVTLLSLWFAGKIPAVLNYTTGPAVLLACARLAGLKQVVTSRSFLARAGIAVEPLQASGIELVYLEDVRAGISSLDKLRGAFFSRGRPLATPRGAEATALILFTSGSEGEPKGVELTHRNVLANIRQMLSVIDLVDADRFFTALPLFHSFGLTVGLLVPLVKGIFVFLYPSPLHYRVVPSAFYNLDCTIFFGTNTFLAGYARKAHPYDFRCLRYVIAGAEKMQESTSTTWMRKFGVRVLEGYGTTECSPVVSVNVPTHPRHGSVGQPIPALECRIEPVEGVGGGAGRLYVRGPNIMKGYLNADANATFQALGGWYDTGDIARVDEDGFLHILGRLKRFAKISGEMISLTAVEEAIAGAFPQFGFRFATAVIAKPDEVKGEKLVAVTNEPRLTLEQVREAIRARGLGNLAVPRELMVLHDLPRLGTGKVNIRELEKIVRGQAA